MSTQACKPSLIPSDASAARWKHYDTVISVCCDVCHSKHTSCDPSLLLSLVECPVCELPLEGSRVQVVRRRICKIINSWTFKTQWVNTGDLTYDTDSETSTGPELQDNAEGNRTPCGSGASVDEQERHFEQRWNEGEVPSSQCSTVTKNQQKPKTVTTQLAFADGGSVNLQWH